MKDNQTRKEWLAGNQGKAKWFRAFRHAAIHASDAYRLAVGPEGGQGAGHLGKRFTLVKLASPSIEALRQAFLARKTRLFEPYERDESKAFKLRSDLPASIPNHRPWLRSLRVTGPASFFGGPNNAPTEFRFSPDLTCIIGGSMTGKSTLLDGLRIHFGAPLPSDETMRKSVEERGRQRFLAGGATIDLELIVHDDHATLRERWPAQFFTQGELRTIAKSDAAKRDIVYRLASEDSRILLERDERFARLDKELAEVARELRGLREKHAEAEQACERSVSATGALAKWKELGLDDLRAAQTRRSALALFEKAAIEKHEAMLTLQTSYVATPPAVGAIQHELTAAEFSEFNNVAEEWKQSVAAAVAGAAKLVTFAVVPLTRATTAETKHRSELQLKACRGGQPARRACPLR